MYSAAEALKYAVRRYGRAAEQTQEIAKDFCRVMGWDPYRRYALQADVVVAPYPHPELSPSEPPVQYEWQRAIALVPERGA